MIKDFYNCFVQIKSKDDVRYASYCFDWDNLSESERELFYEQFEGNQFLNELEDYLPFAILSTSNDFEEMDFEEILNSQIDGLLLLDKVSGQVFLNDEGTTIEFCSSLNDLKIT